MASYALTFHLLLPSLEFVPCMATQLYSASCIRSRTHTLTQCRKITPARHNEKAPALFHKYNLSDACLLLHRMIAKLHTAQWPYWISDHLGITYPFAHFRSPCTFPPVYHPPPIPLTPSFPVSLAERLAASRVINLRRSQLYCDHSATQLFAIYALCNVSNFPINSSKIHRPIGTHKSNLA